MSTFSTIGLIMSGAFVNQELIAEFGILPPSFLPLGVGRLYDMQVESMRRVLTGSCPLYMTVPESFEPSVHDLEHLQQKGVTLLPVPDGMILGEALVYAINVIDGYNTSIRVLHGDTIIGQLPTTMDIVSGHTEGDDYSWAAINHKNNLIDSLETIEATSEGEIARPMACGYFAFSSGAEVVRAISQARGNFIDGINRYLKRRPMTLEIAKDWYDFGHIQTYFRSRRLVSTARAFNSLQITNNSVRKFSTNAFKMMAEAEWLGTVPPAILPYTARLLDKGTAGASAFYTTEYQYAPNLSELYVFSTIGQVTWQKILTSCAKFLEICALTSSETPREPYTRQLMSGKTLSRLEAFAQGTGFDIDRGLVFKGRPMPSLRVIVQNLNSLITFGDNVTANLMHGDFCFSNILYNSRNSRISVIDPRGYVFDNKQEIWGDLRYDIAKFSHSVDGLYDFILAGCYHLQQDDVYSFDLQFDSSLQRTWLQKTFADMRIAGVSPAGSDIRAITTSLFISMLPLHADRPDRQKAFIANALRLYTTLEGKN